MMRHLVGQAEIIVAESERQAGELAAAELASVLRERVSQAGSAAVILATGNSQTAFIEALRQRSDVPWGQVTAFHMDEYIGLPPGHPADFRRILREGLLDRVGPAAFHEIDGNAADLEQEIQRYGQLLSDASPVACVLGIGENGHLAFNDPPADFTTAEPLQVVQLAQAAREQQVHEGHFHDISEVPLRAVTITIPVLLRAERILTIVPEGRKAKAVKAALEGPISPDCPASILRQTSGVTIYLDPDSSSLLDLNAKAQA
jgi:glucosamine-6-phosphate deaminase